MTVRIYHNPRCSKSRQTLALLEERGVSPEIVLYLDTPPTAAALKDILAKLGKSPRDLMRKKETPYKDLNLADESLSGAALVKAMVENPILIGFNISDRESFANACEYGRGAIIGSAFLRTLAKSSNLPADVAAFVHQIKGTEPA